jgi:hypothetical protein
MSEIFSILQGRIVPHMIDGSFSVAVLIVIVD